MKRLIAIFFLLALSLPVYADRITALITVTNNPSDGDTFTVNGVVRTWKTTVATPATQISITNTANANATNLFNQITANPYAGPLAPIFTATNAVSLLANNGNALVVTASGTWANITTTTQTVTSLLAVRWPISGEPTASVRTNEASSLIQDLSTYSTNSFSSSAIALSNYVALTTTQAISGVKVFTGGINGTVGKLTNGTWVNAALTNGSNFGLPFRSPGGGAASEQFGFGASATTNSASAFGNTATATGEGSSAFGADSAARSFGASAFGQASVATGNGASAYGFDSFAATNGASAFGNAAVASGVSSSAFGDGANATTNNAGAYGAGAISQHINASAFGYLGTTTTNDQNAIGTSSQSTWIPGTLQVDGAISNANFVGLVLLNGTNIITGQLAFPRKNNTSLANGNNAAVNISTNVYVKVSGPSAVFTINGIAGGADGRVVTLQNSTGFNMTIANDSGTDPTATNRIYTGTAADVTLTNNPSAVSLIYDTAVTHWIVTSQSK